MFATPFVVVVGCGHPTERPPASRPTATVRADTGDEVAIVPPSDALVFEEWTPPDAPPFDPADERTWSVAMRCKDPNYKGSCNPPRPDAWVSLAIERQVVQAEPKEGGLVFVFGTGGRDVAEDWRGVFLGPDGAPIAGTEFAIRRLTKIQVVGFIEGRVQLPSERVRLMPPGEARAKP